MSPHTAPRWIALAILVLLLGPLVATAQAETQAEAQAEAQAETQATAAAEPTLAEQIDDLVARAYPDASAPGVALLAVDDGEVVYRGARGMANVELGVPLSADHVFRIGSITKQFTAAAILLLEEDGELSIDDPITKFLPDYPTHGHTITVEHLLTHTSGIFSYTSVPGFMDQPVRLDVTIDEMVESFHPFAMEFAPGESWNYSNSGYVMLGAIIEKVSGTSYAEFIEERIFEPLGMENSHYGGHQIIPGRVTGYSAQGDGYVNAGYISMTQPHAAGSLLSTVDDLARWNAALAGGEVVSEAAYERMATRYTLASEEDTRYGYGLFLGDVRGHPTVYHGGGIHGFTTFGVQLPEDGVFVTALSNYPGGGMGPGPLALQAAALLAGDPFPTFERAEVPAETLERYVGVYRIDEDSTRTLTVEDGKVFTQRSGGAKIEAIPHEDDGFFYEQSLTHFEIVTDDAGEVSHMLMYHDGALEPERADLTDEEVPVHTRVEVDPAIYDRYVGRYEIAEGFILTITRDGDRLMSQATGQEQIEIFPSSETEFFLEVVDAQLVFEAGDLGPASAVVLHQGGQVIRAPRVEE